ncbi:NADPH-dependent FMN reductase [Nonomuraea dietziae]|uniref:FMN reductase n=1 Tax=Nonomuraea dietziae TaxID=65515 RepID=A0A7W5VFZ5_9ACTN|nr:NAD(P)H-dependent oxidoreductase [Nonomuraea dietziae]MBB3730810.1 FMN reductase [Nonomuraea dietziae]
MNIVTVVGNPRTGSRTLAAAVAATEAVAARLGQDCQRDVVDLSALGPVLLDTRAHAGLEVALELVRGAHLAVIASPTYKATYTGLLKAFLDRLPPGALAGRTALPVLVMGDPRHALAVEVHFRPLLLELGASVPTPGLALLESDLPGGPALAAWADLVVPQIPLGEEALR